MSDTKTDPKNGIPEHFRSIPEYRTELEGLGEKLNDLKAVDADKRDASWKTEVQSVTGQILQSDLELRAVQQFQMLDLLDRLERFGGRVLGDDGGTGPSAALEVLSGGMRTAGDEFVDSDAYKQRQSSKTDAVQVRTLITTDNTGSPYGGAWLPKGQPIPPQPRQARLFVRDLLSVQQTGLASVPYIRELNAATNEVGASSVSEGGLKPELVAEFTLVDAPARKIAGWIPVTTEIVEDAPTIKGYIDTRLVYMLLLREEQQVLKGSGTAPQLTGILNTVGVQTQSSVTDNAQTIGTAIGKVENVDGAVDGIAMNPVDFWATLTHRDSTSFDFGFSGNLPYGSPPNTLWGNRVVRTRSLASKKAIVGAWALGATLFEREAPTVRTLDQHSDYAIYNKLVILAEERVALAVHRPDFFVDVTLP